MDALLEAGTSVRPSGTDPGPAPSGPAEPLATGSHYRVLRFHARGGLGEVHVARDEGLRREVALKRLQPQHAPSPVGRRRFLWEAEVTSRLEHPGVVPVHTLGQDEAGRPFYTMRFVKGETLHEAIQRFHAAEGPGRDPRERRLALRELVSRLVAVCNTVAYAHSCGILHRDVKPGNVLLGPYGETLLVDWGLAKILHGGGRPPGEAEGEQVPPAEPGPAAAADFTQPGAVVGTPAYMSPEQAAGRWDLVGPASDVYSLGATLYLVLAGQPACQGRDVGEVLDRARRGDFAPPRQRARGVPPALEAVCLRAMALRPEDRYPTALAVAADLGRWLADEPVGVWREPWPVRCRRWCGRHRVLVAAGAAAALVAVVSLAVAAGFLQAAYARERSAAERAQRNEGEARGQKREAEKQRDEAARTARLARRAVEQLCVKVTADPRLLGRDLEGFRKDLLQLANGIYQELMRIRSDDAGVLAEQADVSFHLGGLTEATGPKEKAVPLYQAARAIYGRLAREYPADPAHRRALGAVRLKLGLVHSQLKQAREAEAEFQASLAVRRELAAEYPREPDAQHGLAMGLHALGNWRAAGGKKADAETFYRQAEAIWASLPADHAARPGVRKMKAANYLNLAGLYHGGSWRRLPRAELDRRLGRSEAELVKALAILKGLARAHPLPEYENLLGMAHNNLAVLADTRRPKQPEALTAGGAVLGLMRPAGRPWDALVSVAATRALTGAQLDEVLASYGEALRVRERLARAHPTVSDYQRNWARTLFNVGVLHLNAGRRKEAEEYLLRALPPLERLVEGQPRDVLYRQDLGQTYDYLGNLARRRGNDEDLLKWSEGAIRTMEELLKLDRRNGPARACLARGYARRAEALTRLGRPPKERPGLIPR
jgi:serine/threonine protein kinase